MSERRETGRARPPIRDRRSKPKPTQSRATPVKTTDAWETGERIAKYLARAGVGSRRACEALIADGKVTVNGERLLSPAVKVTGDEHIKVGRQTIRPPEPTRVWRYHKPAGLITTNTDPAGRSTIFEQLPKTLPRVVTVGRLDLNTEGLLLLTNDGELARSLELPTNAFRREYRARAFGKVDDRRLASLRDGVNVDGERFGAIEAELEQELGANAWLRVSLTEGKKREVRRALLAVGLEVNRLIRTKYGPFELGALKPGAVEEVPNVELAKVLDGHVASPPKETQRKPPKRRFAKRR